MKIGCRILAELSRSATVILFLRFSLALAMLLAAPFAGAQSTGGRIRGTVSDPSGASVAAATVTLVNEATHATREVQTSASGEYLFHRSACWQL